uniref:Histone H2A deubiquitinase MYSM1 isoform X1 n=1 Tax=Petromyzon marinus TaxID=7757 RepID=A0AAJ7X6N6_PETMA|nr:histone H2A deubiquitinase MYSM1 isoform X1 [Petromyzon marinus]
MAGPVPEVDVEGDGDDEAALLGLGLSGSGELGTQSHVFPGCPWGLGGDNSAWTLDYSIDEESRAVIRKMLQEEDYYLTGRGHLDEPMEPLGPLVSQDVSLSPVKRKSAKGKGKAAGKTCGTSFSTGGGGSGGGGRHGLWSSSEKAAFEEGLAQYGKRWTKLSELIPSRTLLQVRSYARHYLKHKQNRLTGSGDGSEFTAGSSGSGSETAVASGDSTQPLVGGLAGSETVRVRTLSDGSDSEVEVDVLENERGTGSEASDTEDERDGGERGGCDVTGRSGSRGDTAPAASSSELDDHAVSLELCPTPCGESDVKQRKGNDADDDSGDAGGGAGSGGGGGGGGGGGDSDNCNIPEERNVADKFDGTELAEPSQRKDVDDDAGSSGGRQDDQHKNNEEYEEEEEEEESEEVEEERAAAPLQELVLEPDVITDAERRASEEFFQGRPSKTPERYLKIRNYIVEEWERIRPRYLNKTAVRSGLKNCGDVNCIGRVHTALELLGAINFGCELAVCKRPRVVGGTRGGVGRGGTGWPDGADDDGSVALAHRLQSMRTRKRRVRDSSGNWCSERELEGQTYEHLTAEELAERRRRQEAEEEARRAERGTRPQKRPRGSLCPFRLVPCSSFTADRPAPFRVLVRADALIVMDIHAHVSSAEVIGLLGGHFHPDQQQLEVCAAEPCDGVSTGLQCEMDAVAQTRASEALRARGRAVLGWYHSHPAFPPSPSLRDIDTQAKYQGYFAQGGAQFVGMIISPYDPGHPSPHSQLMCLTVTHDVSLEGHRLPFRLQTEKTAYVYDPLDVLTKARAIAEKYSTLHSGVPMLHPCRGCAELTYLQKMLVSLRHWLEVESGEDAGVGDGAEDPGEVVAEVERIFTAVYAAAAAETLSHTPAL